MLYSAPLFLAMAAWAGRAPRAPPTSRADWMRLIWLGCIGYYLSSLLDFMGLRYITASLERLVLFLYPTIVVLLSALLLGRPVTRRAVVALVCSYAGIALVFWHDLQLTGNARETLTGGGLVFAAAILYALYLVQAGGVIARLGSTRFIAWAMLASTVFIVAQFLLTRPLTALAVPAVDPRPIAGDGVGLHRIADLAGCGIHTSNGRQLRVAGRLARSGLHDRTRGSDSGRTGPRDSIGRRGARAGRRYAGHAQDTRYCGRGVRNVSRLSRHQREHSDRKHDGRGLCGRR